MSGFKPDETVDSGGFRGIIPDSTTVPCIIIDSDAKMIKLKNGNNAGRTATIYRPVLEVIFGKYKGARIYGDIWCNVEADPSGGDPTVFGSHSTFCKLCDIGSVMDPDDGNYPVAASEEDAKRIAQRFVNHILLVTVGTDSYVASRGRSAGKTVEKNTVKDIVKMTEEQESKVKDNARTAKARFAKFQAQKAVASGVTGLEDIDDLDDNDPLF